MHNLIPKPASITMSEGGFLLSRETKIVSGTEDAIRAIGILLAEYIEQHTKLNLTVVDAHQNLGNIHLILNGDARLGEEGYELIVDPYGIRIQANFPAGLFYGIQTLRQMLSAHQTTLNLPAVSIVDSPRFTWRGTMFDVARHFFSVEDVKHYINLISHYKINRLHLHLTDDQGWRIEIKSWPKLTEIVAQSQVNGGGGGFYTQAEYQEIVAYAASRYFMIIPGIDTPGHTNAALASYAELNVRIGAEGSPCPGRAGDPGQVHVSCQHEPRDSAPRSTR